MYNRLNIAEYLLRSFDVDVDERGLIYMTDRYDGFDIVEFER